MNNLKLDNRQQPIIYSMKKADIALIAACFVTALLFGIFFMVQRGTGSTISISRDGTELYRIDLKDIASDRMTHYYLIQYEDTSEELSEDSGQDIHIMHFEEYPEIPTEQSYNLFSVTDGTVTMEAADCRDQICVHHKPISADRESIICLPNKLVLEMSGNAVSEGQNPARQGGSGTSEEETDEPLDGVVG